MKKSTLLLCAVLSLLGLQAVAQQKNIGNAVDPNRCGTMEAIEQRLRTDPEYRARWEKGQEDYLRSLQGGTSRTGESNQVSQLTGPVTIPVVVHIVLPNPNIITDADVQYFINRLNLDFSGLNPDSTNAPLFYGVRGHSLMRFQLARRDPAGNLTNGIERKVGNVTIIGGEPQPIKNAASGGLNPWNHTQYYNLWVGVASGGLLGIAPEIGPGTASNDGVCVNYQAFSNSSCYTIPAFALARTAVHEIGHNFGLLHTFQGNCAVTNDFGQLGSPSCQLPDSLLGPSDDTPAQNGPTFGCPTGAQAAGCAVSPNPPGKNYQNMMDYADDPCMTMFTNGQVKRMHWVLEYCRPGYLTTQGHLPPAGAATIEAQAFESVNPGGYELVGCAVTTYPSTVPCAGGAFVPKFRIRNNAVNNLTTVTAGYILNGAAPVTQNVTTNLATGATTVVTFPSTTNTIVGTNTIKFFTSNPNGGADQNGANDTVTATFTISAGTPVPIGQNFVTTTFPPAPWTIFNPNNNNTWVRNANGNGNVGSAFIDNYNFNLTNQIDEIRSPNLGVTYAAGDSVIINFDVAHRYYPGLLDTFQVFISTNCGATWTSVYKKWGTTLAVNPTGFTGNYTTPAPADWRQERLAIGGSLISGGSFMVAFRNTNRYGNNIFLDNINIAKKVNRDLRLVSINRPGANECGTTFTPQVTINNQGAQPITEFKVGYRVDNGANTIVTYTQTINPGQSVTVTAPSSLTTTLGAHTFTAFTTDPVSATGTGDENTANDTLSKSFTVLTLLNTPVRTDFENPQFPPPGWQLLNPDNNVTWIRRTPGRNSANSMFIDNYNFNLPGQIDELRSPAVTTVGADSIIYSFDLAQKSFSATLADTISVYVSNDCGNTYTAVYKRWNAPVLGTPFVAPVASDWINVRVPVGGTLLNSGSLIWKIRNTNRYGNNVFVDNINIEGLFKRDATISAVATPTGVVCTPSLAPAATVKNMGSETITAVKVGYSIDGGAAQTISLTGLTLARNQTLNVTLPASNITPGGHTIKIYTFDPVTVSGTGDQNVSNDTTTKQFFLVGSQNAPLVEGFEGAQFPPTGWAVVNPDGGITWSRSNFARTGTGSAYINNYNYNQFGQKDELYTPNITFTGVDSVTFSFDLAAVTYSYPGSTGVPMDTLEIFVTTNCGQSFTRIWRKWGEDLQTIKDPNFPQQTEFFPGQDSWRKETIDLSSYAPNGPIQLVFRSTTNWENNIFIDNVSVTTRTLPARLKNDGYLILPSPFQNQFSVWHYRQPTNLRFVTVYNAAGQLVWSKQFSGNADKLITVDLSNRAAGVYTVNIGYEDSNRNVSQQIIKL